MRSRRSLATLLQDGLSRARRSHRLFWQSDVLRYTTQFLITAYTCNSRLLRFRLFFVALHCCLNEKTTLFPKCANFIRHVFDIRADTNNPHDGFVHFPFKYLTHEGCFGFSDGLVPFGMLPFTAPFPCLLSLFCNRGPSEGELGRSHLPLPSNVAVPKVVAKSHLANFQSYTVQMVNLLIRDSFPPPAWDFSLSPGFAGLERNSFGLGISGAA